MNMFPITMKTMNSYQMCSGWSKDMFDSLKSMPTKQLTQHHAFMRETMDLYIVTPNKIEESIILTYHPLYRLLKPLFT